jgi:ABC-type glycerol-3-phosphate transport system permease component
MSLTTTIRRERAGTQAESWRRRTAQRTLIRRAIAYIVLILGSLAMIGPFAWMVSTSLKQEGSVFIFPPVWIPHPVRWDNYVTLFSLVPFGNAFVNSIIVATAATVGQVLSASLAAYAFARLRFRGRNILFIIFLGTMMVPSQVTLIPTFILFRAIGWINTLLPLTVPAFFGSAFGIFLLRQFFLSLPRELFEAAVIDGASPPHMYGRLALPLAKPALATFGVFVFMGAWNDLITPAIYINDMSKMTLPLVLAEFNNAFGADYTAHTMAGAVLSVLPLLIAFLLAQKYFVQGITLTGLKG